MTAQVAATVHCGKATLAEQLAHRFGLLEAMFQQQPATGLQIRRCLVDDQAQIVQTIDARHQRAGRLEAQVALAQMLIARGDIGRIAENQLKAFTAQRTEPVAVLELWFVLLQTLAIALGLRLSGL